MKVGAITVSRLRAAMASYCSRPGRPPEPNDTSTRGRSSGTPSVRRVPARSRVERPAINGMSVVTAPSARTHRAAEPHACRRSMRANVSMTPGARLSNASAGADPVPGEISDRDRGMPARGRRERERRMSPITVARSASRTAASTLTRCRTCGETAARTAVSRASTVRLSTDDADVSVHRRQLDRRRRRRLNTTAPRSTTSRIVWPARGQHF